MSIFSANDLDRFSALYPERPGKLTHGLAGHPLLSLEALVGLAGRRRRAVYAAARTLETGSALLRRLLSSRKAEA